MTEKHDWGQIAPDEWDSLLRPGIFGEDEKQNEKLDNAVCEKGPDAIPYLTELVANSETDGQVRYRSMGWLVALYGKPGIDKEAVVKALENVVNLNLEPGLSEVRRDALMALARLRQNAFEVEPDLEFLLELAERTAVSDDAGADVLLALAETRSPQAIGPIALGILKTEHRGLRNRLAKDLPTMRASQWTDIAAAFMEHFKALPIRGSDIDTAAIVSALNSPRGENASRRPAEIAEYLIESSINCDERIAGVLARLLIESQAGSQSQAGFQIDQYERDHKIPVRELESLRLAVGGPAVDRLRSTLGGAKSNDPQDESGSRFPDWAPIAGLGFAAATFVAFVGLVVWSLLEPIPASAEFPIVAVLALGLAFASGFIGGDAAAKGKVPIPGLNANPVQFSVGGGIAVFVIVFLIGMSLYS